MGKLGVLFEGDRPVAVYDGRPQAGPGGGAIREVDCLHPLTSPCKLGEDYGIVTYVAYEVEGERREVCVRGDAFDARVAVAVCELPAKPAFLVLAGFECSLSGDGGAYCEPCEDDECCAEPSGLALELLGRIDSHNAPFVQAVVSCIPWNGAGLADVSDSRPSDEASLEGLRVSCLMYVRDCWDQFTDQYGMWDEFDKAYQAAGSAREKKAVLNLWASVIDYGIPFPRTAVEMVLNDELPGWWRAYAWVWEP